jgi:hypothetical protein
VFVHLDCLFSLVGSVLAAAENCSVGCSPLIGPCSVQINVRCLCWTCKSDIVSVFSVDAQLVFVSVCVCQVQHADNL